MTGQLPWRLSGSGTPLTWRLKKSTASPFTGFTATSKSTLLTSRFRLSEVQSLMLLFLQTDMAKNSGTI